MIERKIEVQKDKIIKSIDENLLSVYLNMGWLKVEPKSEKKSIGNFKSNSYKSEK